MTIMEIIIVVVYININTHTHTHITQCAQYELFMNDIIQI